MEKLDRVVSTFRLMQRRGRFPGGQLAVYHRGALVIDEAVGQGWIGDHAVGRASCAVQRDTPFCVWSASKPLVAMTIAALEERGKLDLKAPIAELLPEFGRRGKERITTLDVLTHCSGIVVPELGQVVADWDDWHKGLERVYSATPRYPRGTLVYHPYEFGWILAAVAEAASGRRFPEVFAELIAEPAGLAPARFAVRPDEVSAVAHTYLLGDKTITVSGVRYDANFRRTANKTMLSSFVPGGSFVTTASALCTFYATLVAGGIAPNGRRVFAEPTVAAYTRRQATGWDPLNRLPLAFARGFLVGSRGPSLFGPWGSTGCYGHGGALCAFAFADPRTELAGAILTNGNWGLPEFVFRFMRLVHGLRGSVSRGGSRNDE